MAQVIRGTVRDETGRPVRGARAYFVDGPGAFPDIAALTDDRGGFTLAAPGDGTYAIECTADGFAPRRVTVGAGRASERALEIRLERA
jgi:hypothetical protein